MTKEKARAGDPALDTLHDERQPLDVFFGSPEHRRYRRDGQARQRGLHDSLESHQ